jgi:translation initiation factor IF-2
MDEMRIEDAAKKLKISVEEVVEKLKAEGIDVNKDAVINEKILRVLGIEHKQLKEDKRQELLKKAQERRKKNMRSREVYIKDNSSEGTPKKRITKEELLKKKKELESNLKKVEVQREMNKARKQEEQSKSSNVKEKEDILVSQTKKTVEVDKSIATDSKEKSVEKIEPIKVESSNKEKTQDKTKYKKDNKAESKTAKKDHSSKKDKTDNVKHKHVKDKQVKKHTERQVKEEKSKDKSFDNTAKVQKKPVEKSKKEIKPEPEIKKPKTKKAPKPDSNIKKILIEGIEELDLEKQITEGKLVEDDVFVEEVAVEEEKTSEKTTKQKSKNKKGKKKGKKDQPQEKVIIRPDKITIGEKVTVGDFAHAMGIKSSEIVMKLMSLGIMASVTQAIDFETAQIVAADYGVDVVLKTVTEEDFMPDISSLPEEVVPRPPIVTVMGHVDHGKTSLLDCIRKTRVADKEAGGITQHIGAYEVEVSDGNKITFLDTPGHEAFTTLRARGANVTDIVILVVAADDGVMPQTIEAIDHSKAAGVRMIVAINKIDKDNANPEVIKTQLSEHGVIPEEWGGDVQFQEISAKKNLYIDELLEKVIIEAEMLELKGNPERPAEGVVIESRLDKHKGALATVLVSNGTLRKGDNFVVGTEYGKVRAMFNYKGRSIKDAGPSCPVEVMGFNGVPESGEKFIVVENEKNAKSIAELRIAKKKEKELLEKSSVSLTDLFDKIKQGEIQDINIVIKADVQGSVEALKTSLTKLSNAEVNVNIIHNAAGGINESDVLLASASNAFIIGFNVRPDSKAVAVAEREGVEINLYSVIYEAIDDVKKAMEGMLSPELKEEVIGKVEVRQVFSVPKVGKVAGCYVTDGYVTRDAKLRIIRDNIVIYTGEIDSLKRFSDDVKEVKAGYECGIGVVNYNDIKEGDIFEIYKIVEEKRSLDDIK